MTVDNVMEYLEAHAKAGAKKTLLNHGAKEPVLGVLVGDMKPIQKKIGKNYELSLALYDTGITDAMYLAGLIADEKRMTEDDLENWVANAYWSMLNEYAVAWVTAESRYGWELALKCIDSDNEIKNITGWSVLTHLCSIKKDNELDIEKYSELIDFVEKNLHFSPSQLRYVMNSFIITVGVYILPLREKAITAAGNIGKVYVNMAGTDCKVPDAVSYINKSILRNPDAKKKKTCRC